MTPDQLKALNSVLNDRQPLPWPSDASDPAAAELYDFLLGLREFTLSLVHGDLSHSFGRKGFMVGALKSLQANLRHLTWQTQRISQGDFSQRIDFMGDFAAAFNSMTQQLQDARTELEEANRILKIRADTDGLTGLYNHAFLMNTLQREIERSRRYALPLSIALLDIDHFKNFNDSYGHLVGDAVLQKTAELIREALRPSDTPGRYGGEEFMLVLPNTDCDGARMVGERVRDLIQKTPFTDARLGVTISAGIATWKHQKMAELIQAADDRLYEAKRSGRNRVAG